MENEALKFIINYENAVKELSRQSALAYFDASISGKSEDYQKASELQLQLEKIHSDKKEFEKVVRFKNSDKIQDSIIKRQIDLIYNFYAGSQIENSLLEKIINLSQKLSKLFQHTGQK